MGLLDSMLKSLGDSGGVGALLRDNPQIVDAAKSFLGSDSSVGPSGGLNDILSQLQSSGLGDAVTSWLSSGENKAVSASEVQSALGDTDLSQFASKAGIDLGQAAGVLAGMLPQLVDQMSPEGSMPDSGGLNQLLGGLFGKS